jgi:hypothetical protein
MSECLFRGCFAPRVPVSYRVTVEPVGDSIKIEARFMNGCLDHPDAKPLPSLSGWIGPHPSARYVDKPNALMRRLGDTFEGRIERAKEKVTVWAERDMQRRREAAEIARRTAA